MGTYVSTAQVGARLPYRTIDGSSSPSSTQVGEWIDEAEAILHGALNAIEVSTPITGTDGTKIMRSWVLDYSVGRTREALAAAGGDHGNDAGREEIERFNTQIEEILNNSMRGIRLCSKLDPGMRQRARSDPMYWITPIQRRSPMATSPPPLSAGSSSNAV